MIDQSTLRQLGHYVERNLAECDRSHRLTIEFAARRGLDVADLLDVVKSLGGCCCDCEVLLNVMPRVE